jgi:hypothetical protein
MKCTSCGQECFAEQYPEVVFQDENNCICEKCSLDYEDVNGNIQYRQDLIDNEDVNSVYPTML